jgi:RHS repeat-associated protein
VTSGARNNPTTHHRRAALVAAAALLALLLPAAAGAYAAPPSQKLASGGQTWIAEANVRQKLDLEPVSRWGHDYLHARYYSNTLARFVSVDPKGGSPGSSQSWNRYAYATNNPLESGARPNTPCKLLEVVEEVLKFVGPATRPERTRGLAFRRRNPPSPHLRATRPQAMPGW